MKSRFLRVAIPATLGLGGLCTGEPTTDPFAGSNAEDLMNPDPGPPRMLSVQVEYIEVSHEQLLDLLYTGDPPMADSMPLRKKLQGMIQAGQAKLLETTLVSTRSGEKASTGSHREWIYPTEFEVFEVPREIDPPGKPQHLTSEDLRGLEAMVSPASPTSFETRDLGASLEVLPQAVERCAELELGAALTWEAGRTVVFERKDSAGNVTKGEMPGIYSMQLNTLLNCPAGRPVFAGALSPMDQRGTTDPSRKVMVFVKCNIERAGPPVLPSDVLVSLHVAEMPQALAAEFDSGDVEGDALFGSTRELVKAGRAKLFETSVLRIPSGDKGTASAVQEHISMTEYNPPGVYPQPDPAKAPPPPLPPQIRLPYVPTSFETRNVGNTLEAEPTVGGEFLDVRWAWDFVLHPGDTIMEDWTDTLGNRHQRKMPSYLAFKANNATTLKSGKWQLVSVQNSSDAKGKIDPSHKLVVFLRADNLAPEAAK